MLPYAPGREAGDDMTNSLQLSRRQFLARLGAASATLAAFPCAAGSDPLVANIEKVVLRRGRDGSGPTWFHPRACMIPKRDGRTAFMTLQTIAGSDYFGPVHWMESTDMGRTWSEPEPVAPLGRVKQPDGAEEGVCDVVPDYHHPATLAGALRCPVPGIHAPGPHEPERRALAGALFHGPGGHAVAAARS